jgi:hypothetical protein
MNMNYGTAVGAGVAMPGQSHPAGSSKASRKRNGDHLASTPVSATAPNATAPAKKAKPPLTIKYAVKELGRGKDKKYDGQSYVIEVCASGLAVLMPCVNVCLVRARTPFRSSDRDWLIALVKYALLRLARRWHSVS